jgi:L-ascorbate metabolism protein UlaG (beta-lactamase superfamily)
LKKIFFCVVSLTLALGAVFAQSPDAASGRRSLLFLGNTGYLLDTGAKKLLFDAPFTRGREWGVIVPSRETLGKIEKALSPFDGLDLILISHNHADHFDVNRLAACLGNNPHAALLAPPDVLSRVRRAADRTGGLKNKLIDPSLMAGKHAALEVNGVTVEVFAGLHHYPDKFQVLHYSYLVDADGKWVFHSSAWTGDHPGDADPGLTPGDPVIDLALLHYFMIDTNIYAGNDNKRKIEERRRIVRNILRPRAIVLHHVYNSTGTVKRLRKLAAALKEDFSVIAIPEKSMEKIPF